MERSRLPALVLLIAGFATSGAGSALAQPVVEVANIPWSTGGSSYRATVTERLKDDIPVRTVVFRRRGGQTPLPGVNYETMDAFLAAMPLAPPARGHLLTLWQRGSGLRVVVFAPRVDGVAVVMDEPSSGLPELADLDSDGSPEILTTEGARATDPATGEDFPSGPVTVSVYRWTGDGYRVSRTVPWSRRLGRE